MRVAAGRGRRGSGRCGSGRRDQVAVGQVVVGRGRCGSGSPLVKGDVISRQPPVFEAEQTDGSPTLTTPSCGGPVSELPTSGT